jgi:hypothetical protein
MGCLESRGSKKNSEEESKIVSFESSLLFNTLNVVDIDRAFHRFATNHSMSSSQLSRAFEKLNLPLSNFSEFYSKFIMNGTYSMRKLNTLGIILSKSTFEERLLTLFQNYDDDVSGELNRIELKAMIDDILSISCDIIPVFALSFFRNDSKLYDYIKEISEIRNSIAGQIYNYLTEDKENVTLDNLRKGFMEDEGTSTLLNTSDLRRYCVKIRGTIIITAQAAIKMLDSKENFDLILDEQKSTPKKIKKKGTFNDFLV